MRRPLALVLTLVSVAWAQKDAAIALAADHPALKPLLAAHEGWTADAYRAATPYGLWRVQLYFPGGDELGWADVSPGRGRVYAWEASYELGAALQRRAERTLYPFVLGHPQVRALLGGSEPQGRWLWYDSWRGGWFVHLERGAASLDVSVRSRRPGSLRLEDLFVERIYFPNVLSFADYSAAQGDRAVALAFAAPEVAAALRGRAGWTGAGTPLPGGRWQVVFSQGGAEVVRAEVDLRTGLITDVLVSAAAP